MEEPLSSDGPHLFWRTPERLESGVGWVMQVNLLVDQAARNLRRSSLKCAESVLRSSAPKQVVLRCLSRRYNIDGDEVVFIRQSVPIAVRNLCSVEHRDVLIIDQFLVIPQIDISKWSIVPSLPGQRVAVEIGDHEHGFMYALELLTRSVGKLDGNGEPWNGNGHISAIVFLRLLRSGICCGCRRYQSKGRQSSRRNTIQPGLTHIE